MVKPGPYDGLKHQKEKRSMDHFAGLDVETSVTVAGTGGCRSQHQNVIGTAGPNDFVHATGEIGDDSARSLSFLETATRTRPPRKTAERPPSTK